MQPEKPLILFEYEPCPMCRRVREALADLALPVEVRPCPREGERFRPEAAARSGRSQFPFLVDENAGVALLESEDIVAHLYATYGGREVPRRLKGAGFALRSSLKTALRGFKGGQARPSRAPDEALELRGDERDPAARAVREQLCELELPYRRTPGPLRLVVGEVELDDPRAIHDFLEARYAG